MKLFKHTRTRSSEKARTFFDHADTRHEGLDLANLIRLVLQDMMVLVRSHDIIVPEMSAVYTCIDPRVSDFKACNEPIALPDDHIRKRQKKHYSKLASHQDSYVVTPPGGAVRLVCLLVADLVLPFCLMLPACLYYAESETQTTSERAGSEMLGAGSILPYVI